MAQISITIPDAMLPRLKAWLRPFFPSGPNPDDNNNPYPEPTNAEYLAQFKEFLKDYVRREVRDFERVQAARAAEDAVTDIEVQD